MAPRRFNAIDRVLAVCSGFVGLLCAVLLRWVENKEQRLREQLIDELLQRVDECAGELEEAERRRTV